ncbi:MAG: DUF1512 family protein [Candidatus Hodarchaeales archaeon]
MGFVNAFTADFWSQVVNIFLWIFVLGFAYPKLMIYQKILKLENSATKLVSMFTKTQNIILKKINKKSDKNLKQRVRSFMQFFVINPVNLDPYGILKKFEFLSDQEKDRFEYFVDEIIPELDEEEKANLMMALSSSMRLFQITKVVKHFLELTKKTKSQYYAMMLEMQLPMIEETAKSLTEGTEALSNGWMIGDSIGPFVAANLIGNSRVKEIDEGTVISRRKYKRRDVIVIKAKGPGGRTGNPGRVLEKLSKKEKISKIITIDAAAKLEGERTGTIAEGVGVAMGGIGVERSYIEDIAVKNKIPLDSIIVKMAEKEAIMPMTEPVLEATPKVLKILDETIERTKEKGTIVVIGVGNTSGVGNSKKDALKSKDEMKKIIKRIKSEDKKKRGFKLTLKKQKRICD